MNGAIGPLGGGGSPRGAHRGAPASARRLLYGWLSVKLIVAHTPLSVTAGHARVILYGIVYFTLSSHLSEEVLSDKHEVTGGTN